MREIKFRAWDKEGKRMGEVFGIDFKPFEVRACFGDYGVEHEFIDEKDGVVLMQFTGLHDKNGKEIWEGDVVGSEEFRAIIFWYDLCQAWGAQTKHSIGTTKEMFSSSKVEVLGNIYEHPSLLTQGEVG